MKPGDLTAPIIISFLLHGAILFLLASFIILPRRADVEEYIQVRVLSIEPEKPAIPGEAEDPPPLEKETPAPASAPGPKKPPLPRPAKKAVSFPPAKGIAEVKEETPSPPGVAASLPDAPPAAPFSPDSGESGAKESGEKEPAAAGSPREEETRAFMAAVRDRIEKAKFYPSRARRMGTEGVVGIGFTVMADGGLGDIRIVRPCPSDILNRAATEAVKRAAPFPARRGKESGNITVEIDLEFKLETGK